MVIGTSTITIVHSIVVQLFENSPTPLYTSMISVKFSEEPTNRYGSMKSFQIHITSKIMMVMVTGLISGNTIRQNTRNGPQPSINAASSRSLGTVPRKP